MMEDFLELAGFEQANFGEECYQALGLNWALDFDFPWFKYFMGKRSCQFFLILTLLSVTTVNAFSNSAKRNSNKLLKTLSLFFDESRLSLSNITP